MNQKPAATMTFHVQPRARRTEVVGWHGDAIKVRLAAPPLEGKANEELIAFLAEALGIPKGSVSLLSGATGRRKRVKILGLDPSEVRARLGVE